MARTACPPSSQYDNEILLAHDDILFLSLVISKVQESPGRPMRDQSHLPSSNVGQITSTYVGTHMYLSTYLGVSVVRARSDIWKSYLGRPMRDQSHLRTFL
jgi:hypothetical protein